MTFTERISVLGIIDFLSVFKLTKMFQITGNVIPIHKNQVKTNSSEMKLLQHAISLKLGIFILFFIIVVDLLIIW